MNPKPIGTPEPATRDPVRVREMFNRIARRYDLANHLLSAGADFIWRARASNLVRGWRPARVLDLACGSGDLALALQDKVRGAEIVAADFSPEMLAVARSKGVRETVLADALALPFDDCAFDAVTVAFGLRNMKDWGGALREMARVLRPGGHLLVLDFSMPAPAIRPFYLFYLRNVLPRAAGWITGERDAYDYLGGSIEAFPSGEAMTRLIEENGYANARALPLTGGIATIYTADVGPTEPATLPV